MRNGSCWSDVVFEEEVIFHTFDFDTSSLEFEVSKSSIWKHPTSCDKGVFFFQLSRNSDDQSRSNYTGLLFYRYVEKHQVRRLVFDNYQKCPVSFIFHSYAFHNKRFQTLFKDQVVRFKATCSFQFRMYKR